MEVQILNIRLVNKLTIEQSINQNPEVTGVLFKKWEVGGKLIRQA